MLNKAVCNAGIANTMTETPKIANKIRKVSHSDAVTITGMAFLKLGWDAPWLNTKTFCAPRGRINPRANAIPWNSAVNIACASDFGNKF
ncbi:hypothetical protein GCM10008013_34080 [Paenibacillus segetis]|uniref:Uncharacterized protein n=1 Tax=Paenibacillus segetis TaxID=1325360 RepID=A0ABQ1YN61_9BACL|nr:hypothetical protein GCM10008013_34080 [Paenibacillus segetis]